MVLSPSLSHFPATNLSLSTPPCSKISSPCPTHPVNFCFSSECRGLSSSLHRSPSSPTAKIVSPSNELRCAFEAPEAPTPAPSLTGFGGTGLKSPFPLAPLAPPPTPPFTISSLVGLLASSSSRLPPKLPMSNPPSSSCAISSLIANRRLLAVGLHR